jgi:outer membrane immunogenic protein
MICYIFFASLSLGVRNGLMADLGFRRLIVAVALSATTITYAAAADLAPVVTKAPVAPPYGWSGFYLGLNAGGGWNNDPGAPICLNPAGVSNGAGCHVVPTNPTINASGFIGGGQIGYNWQFGRLVAGVESDLQGSAINGSFNYAGPLIGIGAANTTGTSTASERLDLFGTVRGRVGIAWDRALLYATGGLAYGHAALNTSFVFTTGVSYPASGSAGLVGGAAGGGVEYAFDGRWSAKLEGLYYNLGSSSIQGLGLPAMALAAHGKTFDFQGAIGRAGVNYRF